MFQRALNPLPGSGGGITIDNLKFDGKTQIHSITSRGATWTATQDCVMAATVVNDSDGAAQVFMDDLTICMAWNGTQEQRFRIGYSGSSTSTPNGIGLFVPKGAVIKTRSDVGSYSLYFYA